MEPNPISNHVERSDLAALLTELSDKIARRWTEKVSAELSRHRLSDTELRDSIPDYLVALSEALRVEDAQTLADRGTEAWAGIARKHALTRVRLGFDIDEVLQEFMILRRMIFEVLREHTHLSDAQTDRVIELVGGALIAAVKSYVDSRDYESRREQARHVGFITHELRNPLTVATAAAGQVEKLGHAVPGLARPSELLQRSLRRLRELIDSTLLAQRLEANEVEVHLEQVRLGHLLEQALVGAEQTVTRKGVQLRTSYDPGALLMVDPKLALSAIQNVVDNAAKFTDKGRIELRVDDQGDQVVFHVWDECDGLSAEELRTLFQPFKRGHHGRAGTGLGLAIAQRAVEAHGQTIHAESSGEHGCHFWFALPKAAHQAQAHGANSDHR